MEYWNSFLTEKSWEILKEIKKKYNFILIGGWATYLWTRQQKSKDIDIIVDIKELQKLKKESLIKNDHLKKYEIKVDEIDIDIYVAYYSKLSIPLEDINDYVSNVEGFRVVSPEALLILKQGAEFDRGESIKGEKDKIDIVSILFFTDIDLKKYFQILKRYSLEKYYDRLVNIVRDFTYFEKVGMNPRELKLKKQEVLKKLKGV